MKSGFIGIVTSDRRIRNILGLLLIALPIVLFFINLFVYAVNIPYNDDYDTVLGFLNQYVTAGNWKEKFDFLVRFENDHRLIFSKIVSLADLRIFHQVDFRHLILAGNFGILIMLAAMYRSFRADADKLLYFIPAAFFLFQPAYNESSLFAIASLANFYVMSFGFLSISLLMKNDKIKSGYFALSLALALLAYFTFGNGVLFLLIGLAFCLYRKDFPKTAIWAAVTVAAFLFFQFYGGKPGNGSYLHLEPKALLGSALYFFTFIGNNFGLTAASGYHALLNPAGRFLVAALPVGVGIAITSYFIFITVKKYYRTNPAVYSLFLFLFLTALGASLARGGFGLDQALTSRYRIVTVFFLILTYFSLMEIVTVKHRKAVFAIFLGFSVLFCSAMFILKQKPMQQHKKDLITSMENWEKTGSGIDPLGHPYGYANAILKTSVRLKIYEPPRLNTDKK